MQRAFLRQPKKSLRSVVVGAGFGGLGAAHKFQNTSEIPINFTIYEKNPSIAGTWYENTYPGVGCDVPAALYTFPFAPNPLWKRFYASGPEIKKYIEDVAKSHDLTKNVQLNSKVTSAQWDEGSGQWRLEVDTPAGKIQDTADILINAGGIFNNWNWPSIEGLKDFEGELLHTANWDESFEAKGKMIAVIGNGSSAVQVMPALQKEARGIKNFFRNPTWLSAPFLSDPKANESSNPEFSEEQKAEWTKDPASYRAFRKGLEHNYNKTYNAWIKGSSTSQRWKESIIESTKAIIGDERKDLLPFVLPSYNLGCRRVSPGPDYLKALKADNVSSKMTGITKVVKDGLIDGEGEFHKLDAIVCATGFDTSYVPKWPLSGRDGATLNKNWEETPTAYLGIMTKDFPNYMMIGGPNTPTGHGSLTRVYDWQENYILSWFKKYSQEKLHSFVPKAATQDAYNVWLQEMGEKLTFSEPCRSWWKNGKVVGPITAVYTGSLLHYHELLAQGPRGEDFEVRYTGKPFDFLGEGVTKREVERGDLAYYIDEEGRQK